MEVADEILDELPRFMLVEAVQAAERGDEPCPACGEVVGGPDLASLLVYPAGVWFCLALGHRRCRRSRMLDDGDPLIAEMSPDTFGLAWRLEPRSQPPRAVLLWETKANFDAVPSFEDVGSVHGGPGLIGYVLRQEGFVVVHQDLDVLDALRPDPYLMIEREDGVELRSIGVHYQSFPGRSRSDWRATAEREGEVLLVYGTALRLDDFDLDHFRRRFERGKVVAGVIPYLRREGTVLHNLESEPAERGAQDDVSPGGVYWSNALTPLSREVAGASRPRLVTLWQFARRQASHVGSEMRRNEDLTRAGHKVSARSHIRSRWALIVISMALAVGLVLAFGILSALGRH